MAWYSRAERSTSSPRSWPDENTEPVAWRTTTETSLRWPTSSRAQVSCCMSSIESALRRSGRSSVSVTMCSWGLVSIFSIWLLLGRRGRGVCRYCSAAARTSMSRAGPPSLALPGLDENQVGSAPGEAERALGREAGLGREADLGSAGAGGAQGSARVEADRPREAAPLVIGVRTHRLEQPAGVLGIQPCGAEGDHLAKSVKPRRGNAAASEPSRTERDGSMQYVLSVTGGSPAATEAREAPSTKSNIPSSSEPSSAAATSGAMNTLNSPFGRKYAHATRSPTESSTN